MIAPNLVVLVRVLLIIWRFPKRDVYWMVADLTFGKTLDKTFEKPIAQTVTQILGTPEKQTWFGKRIGIWSGPEGREYRVESQAIRQAPDHHSRLQ
jgi:hypothetical protein